MKRKILTNILKISFILLLATFVISAFTSVYGGGATGGSNFNPGQFTESVSTEVDTLVNDTAGTVVAILRVVSVAIAIVVLLVIAMKYMISAPGDRADIKKHAVAYVVGTFILFSVTQIITILIEIADKNFSKSE